MGSSHAQTPPSPPTQIETSPSGQLLLNVRTEPGVSYTVQSSGNLSNSTAWTLNPNPLPGIGSQVSIVLADPASPLAPPTAQFFYLEPLGTNGTAVSWTSGNATFRSVIPEIVTTVPPTGHLTTPSADIYWKRGTTLQADSTTLDTAVTPSEAQKLAALRDAIPTMAAQSSDPSPMILLGAPLTGLPGQKHFWKVGYASGDSDGDGFTDYQEFTGGWSTNPYSNDTDGDGLADPAEITGGSNPAGNDSDNDGISDLDETTLLSETQSKSLFKHGFDTFATTTPPRKFLWKTTTWNPNYIGSIVPFDSDVTEAGGRNTFVNQLTGQAFSLPLRRFEWV